MEKSNAYFRFFNETDLNGDDKLYFTCDYKFIENDKLWSYSEAQKNMVSSLTSSLQFDVNLRHRNFLNLNFRLRKIEV